MSWQVCTLVVSNRRGCVMGANGGDMGTPDLCHQTSWSAEAVSVGNIIAPLWHWQLKCCLVPVAMWAWWGWTLAIAAQVCGVRDDKEQLKVGTILQSQSTMNSHSLEREDLRSRAISTSVILFLFEKSLPTPIQHFGWKCIGSAWLCEVDTALRGACAVLCSVMLQ